MNKPLSKIFARIHYAVGASLFFSGIARLHQRLHEFAMRELQRSADLSYVKAQVLFGQLLKYRGATAYNKVASIRYLRESAQSGSKDAQFMLAESLTDQTIIDSGNGYNAISEGSNLTVFNNPVELYLLAANAGHVMAALRLSKIYREGSYGEQVDIEKANKWHAEFLKYGDQK